MYERNYKLLRSKFKEFFLPTLLTSMAGNICLFADGLIVSFLIGADSLSAIQIITPLVTFINLVYWMIGLGGSVLCSVSKAEFNEERCNGYFTVSIISLLVIGILFTIICLIFTPDIIRLLCSTKPELYSIVAQYYNVIIFEMPFLCYLMSLSYFIRVDGFPKLAFNAILIANVINIIFDVIFMGAFNMGLAGAALASVIGYCMGSIIISYYLFKPQRTLKFIRLKVKLFFNYLKNISTSGFSSASTQLYETIKIFIINALVGYYFGKAGIVAYGICLNSLFILFIFLIGTSQTMSPFVSVYFKEEDYSGVDYIVKRSFKIILASSLILSLLFAIWPQSLLMLFSVKNPADIPVVLDAVRIFSISYVGIGIVFFYTFYTQALEKNKISTLISLLEGLIIPVIAAFVFSQILGGVGIWISVVITEIITIVFIYAYSKYINRKTNGEFSGFFINKHNDEGNIFEYTIEGDVSQAVDLSRNVQDYLAGNKSATLVSLAIEEMLVNIININENIDVIDVIVRNNDKDILISIKDTGVDFNPVVENDNLKFDNISVLNKIADKIDYSRVLGLNSTVITIKN